MRRFKYIKYNPWADCVTPGKVYELISYTSREEDSDIIEILNDKGEIWGYLLNSPYDNKPLFEEVTIEYRNSVIDDILA